MENFSLSRRLRLFRPPFAPVASSTIPASVLPPPARAAEMISSSVRRARSICGPVICLHLSVRVIRRPLGASPHPSQTVFFRDGKIAVRRPALISSCRRSSSSTARRRRGFTCLRCLTFLIGTAFFRLAPFPSEPVELLPRALFFITLALFFLTLAVFFLTPALLFLFSRRRSVRGVLLLVLFQERRKFPSLTNDT